MKSYTDLHNTRLRFLLSILFWYFCSILLYYFPLCLLLAASIFSCQMKVLVRIVYAVSGLYIIRSTFSHVQIEHF